MSSAAPPGAAPGGHQDLRRVDWRFLLPSPRLGSVVVLGSPEPELLQGLVAVAKRVTVDPEADSAGAYDLAVLTSPTHADLALASRLLRPGGWAYVEVGRAGGRELRSSRTCAGALRQFGYEGIRRHWHWPSFQACLELVDLDDPGSISMSLARRQASRAATLKAALARTLRRLGMLDRAVPCASVLARWGEGPSAGAEHGIGLLGEPGPGQSLERSGLGTRSTVLLVTPRFETSRAVVALLAPEGRQEPAFVAKIAREPGPGSAIEREARNLEAIRSRSGGALHTVPEVVWSAGSEGWPTLVTTAMNGALVNPRFVRRHRQEVLEAGLAWTLGLPRSAPCRADERLIRLVDEPLERLASGLLDGDSLERTRRALEPLRDVELPVVFEHGDVSHPNLFWLRGERLGVIDWELAVPDGLPVVDLVFFVAYVAAAEARAVTPAEHRGAFESAVAPASGWGLDALRRYARAAGVPDEAIVPLVVACFARYTAGLAVRSGAGGAHVAETGDPTGWIRDSRPYALWQAALARAEA